MMLSFDSAVSAMQQFQQSLNVTANNIANVDTTGFKSASASFADTFSQTLGNGGAAGSQQVGTGVGTESITNQFTQGSVSSTGAPNDLAIQGSGFFTVRDPATGATFATRDGQFQNYNGFLCTATGMRVQGYTAAGSTTVGDIPIDNTGAPGGNTSAVTSFKFADDGTVNIQLATGDPFAGGKVLLQNYSSPQNLLKAGNNLYSGLANAGPLAAPVAAGDSSVGSLQAGALEMSNVDLAGQLASLIVTQRAYEANTKVISTSDEILQTINNLKR